MSLPEDLAHVDGARFRAGMRRLAGAVTLVTTSWNGVRQGLTASAVCSLTADPPSLLACVNKSASAHDPINEASSFAVNVLASDQSDLARVFSDSQRTAKRFDHGRWLVGLTGAPLLEGALVSFDCHIDQRISKSTHTIFIGAVKDVRVGPNPRPLLYFDGTFGGFQGL